MNQIVPEHAGVVPSQAVRAKCAHLVQVYPEHIEEDVRERAFEIAFSTLEELGDIIAPAFDPHPTDLIDDRD